MQNSAHGYKGVQRTVKKSESPFSSLPCPKRLNLLEAFHNVESNYKNINDKRLQCLEDKKTQYVRIMGVVVSKPETIMIATELRNEEDNFNSDKEIRNPSSEAVISFLLDDGSALIDVLYFDETNPVDDELKNKNDGPKLPFAIVLGQTIDIVGTLTHVQQQEQNLCSKEESRNNSCNHTNVKIDNRENDDEINSVLCLLAQSISQVPDPNAETLRFLETCHDNNNKDNMVAHNSIDTNNVIIAGNVTSSLGLFQRIPANDHTNNQTTGKKQRTMLQVDAVKTFQLIQHSTKDEGLSQDDLMLILGCRTYEERLAVIDVLQTLQGNGEIYRDANGLFLPL